MRELLVFACDGDWSAVWLAAGASDLELADERLIVADGLDELASLTEGESFEREVTTGRGRRCRVRWRHAG